MNYEAQVCKQTQEQPAYITSEYMLRMQRASLVRYERSLNECHFYPLFFHEANQIINKIDKFISDKIKNPQQCFIQAKTDSEIAQNISGLIRTVKSLPIVVKNVPTIKSTGRQTFLPCKSAYDLTYHCFLDSSINVVEFSEQLSSIFSNSHFQVHETANGAVIVDSSIPIKTTLQKKCEYTPYNKAETGELPPLTEIETPGVGTIDALADFTKKTKEELVKAVMYSIDNKLAFVNIRGDREVSEDKLRHYLGIADSNLQINVQLAPIELLERHGLVPGFSGLVGVKRAAECTLIADSSVSTVASGVTGANKKDYHFINFNVERDTKKIAKYIHWADVADNPFSVDGSVVCEIDDCKGYLPEMLGLDNKPTHANLYKITIRIFDLIAATIGLENKLRGAYIINIGKDETKLNQTVTELLKYCPLEAIVVDNRAKPNFGGKMQLAEISLFQNVIVVSNKLDADTVSVNDQPVKISELNSIF